jgi:hypothetical protein
MVDAPRDLPHRDVLHAEGAHGMDALAPLARDAGRGGGVVDHLGPLAERRLLRRVLRPEQTDRAQPAGVGEVERAGIGSDEDVRTTAIGGEPLQQRAELTERERPELEAQPAAVGAVELAAQLVANLDLGRAAGDDDAPSGREEPARELGVARERPAAHVARPAELQQRDRLLDAVERGEHAIGTRLLLRREPEVEPRRRRFVAEELRDLEGAPRLVSRREPRQPPVGAERVPALAAVGGMEPDAHARAAQEADERTLEVAVQIQEHVGRAAGRAPPVRRRSEDLRARHDDDPVDRRHALEQRRRFRVRQPAELRRRSEEVAQQPRDRQRLDDVADAAEAQDRDAARARELREERCDVSSRRHARSRDARASAIRSGGGRGRRASPSAPRGVRPPRCGRRRGRRCGRRRGSSPGDAR